MQSIYAINNLPFWSQEAIEQRAFLAQRFHNQLEAKVRARNRAWLFERIEAPMLIPRELLNLEYSDDALFTIAPKMSSLRLAFAQAVAQDATWMSKRLEAQASLPPYCCWQLNKSFRREQDQPTKHMRLKEF